jgi:hypothetical protein
MDSKEILKAIDPKGAEIERLKNVIDSRDALIKGLKQQVTELNADSHKLGWLKTNGVMIETPEGMRYLKDEEFDEFMNGLPKWGDSMAGRLAQAMQNTKETLAANILNKVFDEEYEKRSEELTKELTNGTNTREKGKRRSNKNPKGT